MDEVWNGMRTVDYEHSRPTGTPVEWELYTCSLIAWPQVLMGEPTPYGRLRRPGIVDIDEPVHQQLVDAWHTRLADPIYVADLIDHTAAARARTGAALDALESSLEAEDAAGAATALAEATGGLLTVMSAHIVNWLLPEAAWQQLLTDLLGSTSTALACGSALMTPTDPGRLLNAHTRLPLAHTGQAAAVPVARRRALDYAEAWSLAAILAAAGNDQTLTAVRMLIALSRWAADSEERRAELRDRYLAAIPRWCILTSTAPAHLSIAALTSSGAAR
ncbi:hypothetical protein [Streptosporangium canum]|uniref:hypothetical protein n=1 Tax=Streptosporangium canum TaxID=324952 RepID=UPI00379E6EF4